MKMTSSYSEFLQRIQFAESDYKEGDFEQSKFPLVGNRTMPWSYIASALFKQC